MKVAARGEGGVEQPGMRREVLKSEEGLPDGGPVLRFLGFLGTDWTHPAQLPTQRQFRAPSDR